MTPSINPKIIDIFIIKIANNDKINVNLLKNLKTNFKKSYSIKKLIINNEITNFFKSIGNSKILYLKSKSENINKRVTNAESACVAVAKLPFVSNFLLDKKTGK